MKLYLNAADIARVEKVDRSTVSYWIKQGYLRYVKRAEENGEYRISLTAYQQFKERRQKQGR